MNPTLGEEEEHSVIYKPGRETEANQRRPLVADSADTPDNDKM